MRSILLANASSRARVRLSAALTFAFLLCATPAACDDSAPNRALGIGNWLTFTANVPEAGFRATDFFRRSYSTSVFWWDSRAEFWLPPFRDKFSWGSYVKFGGITESQTAAYPNAVLGGPGGGIQVYPFSSRRFQQPASTPGKILGPLRFFAEYNRTEYLGAQNKWRPRYQKRIGFEYWKAVSVNDSNRPWWAEIWTGLYWQSSNEFTPKYDSVVFANAWRSGIRKPHAGPVSVVSPYVAVLSSRTKYDYAGTHGCPFISAANPQNPCDFFWENGLMLGGGLRFTPSLSRLAKPNRAWLNRFVVYGEYLNTTAYFGPTAPSGSPRFDIRIGISASVGQWYR